VSTRQLGKRGRYLNLSRSSSWFYYSAEEEQDNQSEDAEVERALGARFIFAQSSMEKQFTTFETLFTYLLLVSQYEKNLGIKI